MRTEFKVGLIVGLVIIAGGGIFWSLNRGGGTPTDLPFDGRATAPATGAAQPVGHQSTPPAPPAARDVRPAQPAARSNTPPANTATTPPASATPRSTTPPDGGTPSPSGGTVTTPPSGTATTPPTRSPDNGSSPPAARPNTPPTQPPTTPPSTPTSTPPATPGGSPSGASDRPASAAPDTRTPSTPGSATPSSSTPPVNVPPRPTPAATDAAAAPRPSTPPAASNASKYTVADTDTLSTIARVQYGEAKYWPAIVAANPGLDPDRIRVGQVINLPSKDDVLSGKATRRPDTATPNNGAATPASGSDTRRTETTPPTAPPATPGAPRTYKVAKGDTLTRIARELLKDENRWQEIYELNKDQLASPDTVVEGMELKLPAK